MYHAWHVAAFSRTKEMPALKTILQNEEKAEYIEKREQSPEEMLALIRLYNAALGGKEVK